LYTTDSETLNNRTKGEELSGLYTLTLLIKAV